MSQKETVFQQRSLNTLTEGGITLLDRISLPDGNGSTRALFFKTGTPFDGFVPGDGVSINAVRSIGNGPVLTCNVDGADDLLMSVGGRSLAISTFDPETDLFSGMNTIFAIRNGESPSVVAKWLQFHADYHGMEAALILDRSRPKDSQKFFQRLKKLSKDIKSLSRVVVLSSDIPLGGADLPAEAHPFNVPGAPGKDRMKIPKSDPWAAPLGELSIYELVRARFLSKARAIANVDVFDLLEISDGPTVFDRAVAAPQGIVRLEGTQVYPWRVRKGDDAEFGDHICVPFDVKGVRARWCVAPAKAPERTVWRLIRVVGAEPEPSDVIRFYRHMALRHPSAAVSKIVPKTSLIEHPPLVQQAEKVFAHKPVHIPAQVLGSSEKDGKNLRICIITTMKNEGPFILEWIAYHRAIGVTDFLIYTNDCTDGTDRLLEMLQSKGIVEHRINPFDGGFQKPQHAALEAAEKEPVVRNADWLICMDVDEFINIHTGDGRLADLFAATAEANMISLTWRLFGNSDRHSFSERAICEEFSRCAPQLVRKPHQAWGFKTLFRNQGIFKKLGVHRPKGLKPQLWDEIKWVNGSGKPMPTNIYRNGWRSSLSTYGYDLVTLNHYAVRSAESFLVKRDRGRVNHVDRDQGLSYWFRMNNNAERDLSIQRMLPAMKSELETMMADPDIAEIHRHTVLQHRAKIDELKSRDAYANFYKELTSDRMQDLSRLHAHFGANVFLSGPGVIPDEIAAKSPEEEFFFTVEKGETNH